MNIDKYMFNGMLLKELRRGHNLTQEALANKLNISVYTLIKWENNLSIPKLFDMCKLADFFDKQIVDFIIYKGDI